jgi:heat shock protein HslJ
MKPRRLSALATLSAAVLVTSIALAACGDDSGSSSTANDAKATASSLAAAASSAVDNAKGAVSSAVGAASSALAAASSSIFSGDLEAGTWVLGAGLIDGAAADKRPTIEFKDGNASGFAGCNNYNATVTIDGNNLTFGPMMNTSKACGPVETKIESTYLAQLAKVASYSFAAGRLLLQDKDGKQILIFDTK